MHIFVLFHFNHEDSPVAVTGVEGDVTDLILPSVGDMIVHRDESGSPFQGTVTDRIFEYSIPQGMAVDAAVAITLCLDRAGTRQEKDRQQDRQKEQDQEPEPEPEGRLVEVG